MSVADDHLRAGWLQRLALMMVAFLMGIVLFEVFMRLAGLSFPVFETFDEIRGVKLVPGKEGWYRGEGEAYVRINSLGYRDREHALEKPKGTFRIAVLGDSFTEARQVPIEQTYWHHIGQELDHCKALSGRQIEVLNFGIGGYNTSQEVMTYDLDAKRFAPDLVLLGFFAGNDVQDPDGAEWRVSSPTYRLVENRLVLDKLAAPPIWKRFFYVGIHYSRVLELINELRRLWTWAAIKSRNSGDKRFVQIEVGTLADIYRPPANPDMEASWRLTAALLTDLNDRVRKDGAEFMLATIPEAVQTHPDTAYRDAIKAELGVEDLRYPERRISEIGKAAGFPVITLVERMQNEAKQRHFHGFANTGFGYGHMNATGHRVMGKILASEICTLRQK
jgi:hypothetical protein